MRPGPEPRPSWICRDGFERARFLDLHSRLLRVNGVILVTLVIVIATALPFVASRLGLIPAAAGLVLFGVIQRSAARFARPAASSRLPEAPVQPFRDRRVTPGLRAAQLHPEGGQPGEGAQLR